MVVAIPHRTDTCRFPSGSHEIIGHSRGEVDHSPELEGTLYETVWLAKLPDMASGPCAYPFLSMTTIRTGMTGSREIQEYGDILMLMSAEREVLCY